MKVETKEEVVMKNTELIKKVVQDVTDELKNRKEKKESKKLEEKISKGYKRFFETCKVSDSEVWTNVRDGYFQMLQMKYDC